MKNRKIIASIMSITMLCSCGFGFNTQIQNNNNTVSAMGIVPQTFSCEINYPDFVIAPTETVNEWDLKRHGLKMIREQTNYHDMPEDELYGQQTTTTANVFIDECDFEFPDELQEGKNTVKIINRTGVTNPKLESTIEFNVRFSAEESEKKDLPGRSGVKYGDVDGNSEVDMADLVRLSQYMLGDVNVTAGQYACADANGDEEVDICDIPTLKQYVMKEDIDLGHVQKSFQDIVLITRYTNAASNFQYSGTFYDKEGNGYDFDFSDFDWHNGNPDDMLIRKIKKLYTSSDCKVSKKLSTEDMTYINPLIYKIDPNAGFDEKDYMNDGGQVGIFGVKHNEDFTDELILAYSTGDVICTPKDENAAELYKHYLQITGFDENAPEGILLDF